MPLFSRRSLLLAAALNLLLATSPGRGAEIKYQSSTAEFWGWSVALDDDLFAIGTPFFDAGPLTYDQNLGSVTWYRWNGGAWVQFALTYLDAEGIECEPQLEPMYGWAVSISGDYALVGSPGFDYCTYPNPPNRFNAGTVSWYHHIVETTGVHRMHRLSEIPYPSPTTGEHVGAAIGIGPWDLVIGFPNRGDSGSGKAMTSYRTLSEPYFLDIDEVVVTGVPPDPGAGFGSAVALHGSLAAVGAPRDFGHAVDSGSVRVFLDGAGHLWTQEVQLNAYDGRALDEFGSVVAIRDWGIGALVAVGARFASNPAGTADTGAVYLYERSILPTLHWRYLAKVTPSDGIDEAQFGNAVAIAADGRLAVGAPYQTAHLPNGAPVESGAVYVYERVGDSWIEVGKHIPSDAADFDLYGWSLAFDGTHVIVGAPGNHPTGLPGGAAYFYEWSDLTRTIFADGFESGDISNWSNG